MKAGPAPIIKDVCARCFADIQARLDSVGFFLQYRGFRLNRQGFAPI